MFSFETWDSYLSLIFEVSLSLAIVIGLFLVVRRVNANAEIERRRNLQARDATSGEAQPTSPATSSPSAENNPKTGT